MGNGFNVYDLMSPEQCGVIKKIAKELNNEDIIYLAGILQNMKHVSKIYIDISGNWHIKVHQYLGNLPSFRDKEGKFYGRLQSSIEFTEKRLDREAGVFKHFRIPYPVEETEIVSDYTREYIMSNFNEITK